MNISIKHLLILLALTTSSIFAQESLNNGSGENTAKPILTKNIYSAKEDLFRLHRMHTFKRSPQRIDHDNKRHILSFIKKDFNSKKRVYDRPQNLPSKIAKEIVREMLFHPVISMWEKKKYDPKEQGIGFCFGRAMYAHIDLYMRGFERRSKLERLSFVLHLVSVVSALK